MDHYQIEMGENGFSVCHKDHRVVGECVIEGIQHFGVAHEVAEMLTGEERGEEDPCWTELHARNDELRFLEKFPQEELQLAS